MVDSIPLVTEDAWS